MLFWSRSLKRGERRPTGALMPPPGAIVTGTNAESYDEVFVNLKLVPSVDARIVAAADFVVTISEAEGLLAPPRV